MDDIPKKYILVVDDEEPIRQLLKDVLDDPSYKLIEAEDGETALKFVKSRHIDMVVTDLRMPGMSGADLLKEIRDRFPNMPVLVITGKPTLDAAVDCMKGGAIDFLTKPFDITEFQEMVKDALAEEDRRKNRFANSPNYHKIRNIAGYKVVSLLGEGTSGVVFKAVQNDKEYALKVFKFMTVSESRKLELKERFVRESEFLATTDHPNIVKVYSHGFSDSGIPFLVMELLEGHTLKEHIKDGSLLLDEKLSIIRQTAQTIGYIHQKDIIHRDVKPENIMVMGEPGKRRCVLTDFGIIRMQSSNLTMAANIMGSPAYLAPEGFVSARVGIQSDIFSLGVVLYELLFGQRPFQAADLYQMATAIQHDYPPSPSSIDPTVSPEVEELLARCLKKDVADRFQTCEEFVTFFDYAMSPESSTRPDLRPLEGPNWVDDETVKIS